MNKVSIQDRAKKWLTANKAEEVFSTSDDFLFSRKEDAKSHSNSLEDKKVQTFKAGKEFKVADAPAKKSPKKIKTNFLDQSVPKIEEALALISDVTVVEGYLAEEQKSEDPRSTAIKAFEDRIAALTVTKE